MSFRPYMRGLLGSAARAPLLDTHPGAAGAWSLRQLSSSTTNVVRVRRSSDNAEQDFTAAELQDGTLAIFTGAGDGFVVTLFDQSDNNNDATQATTSAQPLIVDTGTLVTRNGKPAATYDGVDDRLATAAIASLADTTNGFSMFLTANNTGDGFIVAQYNSSLSKRVFSSESNGLGEGNGNYSFSVQKSDAFSTNRVVEVPITQQVNILTGLWGGGNTKSRAAINGETLIEAASTTPSITSVSQEIEIGSVNNGGIVTTGDFQECVLYSLDKTTDRAAIEQDIADYYGITIS